MEYRQLGLGTDAIDLYQLHLGPPDSGRGDAVVPGRRGPGGKSLQAQYNLATRQTEWEMIPAARYNGLGILAWSPLASGFLTGKYDRNEPRPADTRASQDHALYQFTSSNYEHSDQTWASVDAVATIDAASDPHAAPYPYGPFGSAQRDRTANGPEALGQLTRAHANAAKETPDGVHAAR